MLVSTAMFVKAAAAPAVAVVLVVVGLCVTMGVAIVRAAYCCCCRLQCFIAVDRVVAHTLVAYCVDSFIVRSPTLSVGK